MGWNWLWKSPRRKSPITRSRRKSIFLNLEQLEDRVQPASVLESLMPNFDAGTLALYSGGSVGPLTTNPSSVEVNPVHQTGTGAVDPQTSYSYSFDVTGSDGPATSYSYQETYTYSFDTTISEPAGTTIHEWGTYTYTFSVTSSASESSSLSSLISPTIRSAPRRRK